ncbi:hypothetical protein ACOSQ4_017063 [Xanthoceras sorbifolium]
MDVVAMTQNNDGRVLPQEVEPLAQLHDGCSILEILPCASLIGSTTYQNDGHAMPLILKLDGLAPPSLSLQMVVAMLMMVVMAALVAMLVVGMMIVLPDQLL